MKDALRVLSEHFDALQFMGSWVDDHGHTGSMMLGVGNLYARTGLAQEFLNKDSAQTTANELAMVMAFHDDGGDCDCEDCRGDE